MAYLVAVTRIFTFIHICIYIYILGNLRVIRDDMQGVLHHVGIALSLCKNETPRVALAIPSARWQTEEHGETNTRPDIFGSWAEYDSMIACEKSF